MKIKYDFVTNSSSVSFIVCIPNSFRFTYEEIRKIVIKYPEYYDIEFGDINQFHENFINKITEEVNNTLNLLKSGYEFEFDGKDYSFTRLIYDIIPDKYIIFKYDSGPDDTSISGIKKEKIQEIINEDKI